MYSGGKLDETPTAKLSPAQTHTHKYTRRCANLSLAHSHTHIFPSTHTGV